MKTRKHFIWHSTVTENHISSPIICFPFFLETQLLVTMKITENKKIRIFLQFSYNVEFETLIMLYSDSAWFFKKDGVSKLFFRRRAESKSASVLDRLTARTVRKALDDYRIRDWPPMWKGHASDLKIVTVTKSWINWWFDRGHSSVLADLNMVRYERAFSSWTRQEL
jgi:hypothetical protein